MKVKNEKEIRLNLMKYLDEDILKRMYDNEINVEDLTMILFDMFELNETDRFILNKKVVIDALECLIGYREWIKELDKKNNRLCDTEEQFYCNCEKLGCKGCYYDN